MTGQAITTTKTAQDIHALLDRKDVQIELRKALPKHLSPERLIRIAATAIQKSPRLKECTALSLLACVIECGQLGLEPDGVLGEIYLVPFKDQATIIVGYQGFAKLAYQTGDIYSITAHVVRKGERFSVHYGTNRDLEHFPMTHGEEKDDTTWTGAYAMAHFRDGHTDFEWLERADVFRRRARSNAWRQQKTDSPWFTDPEAMWKKSAVRALAKRLPKSTTDQRLARAAAIDELGEAGLLTPTTTGFEIAEASQAFNDPAPDVPLQKAKEIQPEKAPGRAGGKKGKKSAASDGPSPIPKAQIPRDPIDVKATEVKTEKPKPDPTITFKTQSDIYNRGTAHGWKIEDIAAWVRREFGVAMKDIRESMLPKIMRAMESGT